MNIQEQIAWLRGLGGDTDGSAANIADTLERLNAVHKAAKTLCFGWTPRSYWLEPDIERLRSAIQNYEE